MLDLNKLEDLAVKGGEVSVGADELAQLLMLVQSLTNTVYRQAAVIRELEARIGDDLK